jgi:hypothetical protein
MLSDSLQTICTDLRRWAFTIRRQFVRREAVLGRAKWLGQQILSLHVSQKSIEILNTRVAPEVVLCRLSLGLPNDSGLSNNSLDHAAQLRHFGSYLSKRPHVGGPSVKLDTLVVPRS